MKRFIFTVSVFLFLHFLLVFSDFRDLFYRDYKGNNQDNDHIKLTLTLLPCRHNYKNIELNFWPSFPSEINACWFLRRRLKILWPAVEILRGNGSKFVYLWPPSTTSSLRGANVFIIILLFSLFLYYFLYIIVRPSFPYLLIFIYCALSCRNFWTAYKSASKFLCM